MRRLNCRKIQEMLPPYLGGELSEREAREVEEHLRSCAGCRASLKEWERCFHLLGSVPRVEAPPQLWQKIRAHLPKEERKPFPLRWVWVSGIALLIVVVGFAMFTSLTQHRSSRTVAVAPLSEMPPALPKSPLPSKALQSAPPQPPKKAPSPMRKVYRPRRVIAQLPARARPSHPPILSENRDVEDKVVERLQMALLSAQSAETNLERVFKALQGEKEF